MRWLGAREGICGRGGLPPLSVWVVHVVCPASLLVNTTRFMRASAASRVQGGIFISPYVSGVGVPRLFARPFWSLVLRFDV